MLLPRVRDDHDMALYFGRKFHATFAGADACTGLVYAYRCFKRIGREAFG